MDRDVRWFAMPVGIQISNIGGEVERAIRWKNRNDKTKMTEFYNKALELLSLSKKDPKNTHRLGELSFCEEELRDYFAGENYYNTTDDMLLRYYNAFI